MSWPNITWRWVFGRLPDFQPLQVQSKDLSELKKYSSQNSIPKLKSIKCSFANCDSTPRRLYVVLISAAWFQINSFSLCVCLVSSGCSFENKALQRSGLFNIITILPLTSTSGANLNKVTLISV